MTYATRRNIPIARLRSRPMALKASDMRAESCGDCHGNAGTRRSMTSNATKTAQSQMARVVELHVEATEARKWFQRSRLRITVTDRTDRIRRIGKLFDMATGARQMI